VPFSKEGRGFLVLVVTPWLHSLFARCGWRRSVQGSMRILEMLEIHIWVGAQPGGEHEISYMVLHNTGKIFVAWKTGISLGAWWDRKQQNLKAGFFVFLSYELWIELLHRIRSGWNIISEADPYLLNLSFVSSILWALPSCFIVSGPKLWSRSEPRRAAQTFAVARDRGHWDTQTVSTDKRLLLLPQSPKANGVTSEFIVSPYVMGSWKFTRVFPQ